MKNLMMMLVCVIILSVGSVQAEDGGYVMTADDTLHFTTAVNTAAWINSGEVFTIDAGYWGGSCDKKVIKILVKLLTGITVSKEAAEAICGTKLEKLPLLTDMKPTAKSLEEWRINEEIKVLKKKLREREDELEGLEE